MTISRATSYRRIHRAALAVAALLASACVNVPSSPAPSPNPEGGPGSRSPVDPAQQIIVVTTPGWDSTTGVLRRFERASGSAQWRVVGVPTAIVTGRTGLAWGIRVDWVEGDSGR